VVGPAQRLSRPRLETRAGTVELRIPKLRKGSYFPASWNRAGWPAKKWRKTSMNSTRLAEGEGLGSNILREIGSRLSCRSADNERDCAPMPYGPAYDPTQPYDGIERGLLGYFINSSI
jgi:hypothetical protein